MYPWSRIIAVLIAVLVAISTLAACGEDEGDGAEGASGETATLGFCGWGGEFQESMTKAWLDPYVEANPNITIAQDEPTDYSKLKAMVESGNVTWDIVDCGIFFGLGDTEQYCEKLDPAVIPFDELQPDIFPTNGYRVPVMSYSTVLAYRTDIEEWNGQLPTSAADFFDLEKFPGKRSSMTAPEGGLLEYALIADGVPIDELYPLDLDRAFRKLDTIKDEIIFWETGDQSTQLLADGEVAFGSSWNGRVTNMVKDTGAPVEILWQCHMMTADYFVIPKGSKYVAEAMDLIGYMMSAEHNAELSNYIAYGPSNSEAIANVDPAVAPGLPTSYLEGGFGMDDRYWNDNYDDILARWQDWLQE